MITFRRGLGCTCVDGRGRSKRLYPSFRSAEESRKLALLERHVTLRVYECPYARGWHLTKGEE
jgi:hypothetical protein